MYDSGGFSGFAKSSRLYARPHPFARQYTKCGFGIYMVHYFPVDPALLLIGNFNLPIPLQVPVMAILIFLCAWGFTALCTGYWVERLVGLWDKIYVLMAHYGVTPGSTSAHGYYINRTSVPDN